jgi:hypothetical protein
MAVLHDSGGVIPVFSQGNAGAGLCFTAIFYLTQKGLGLP